MLAWIVLFLHQFVSCIPSDLVGSIKLRVSETPTLDAMLSNAAPERQANCL